jgi:hypothetical protein
MLTENPARAVHPQAYLSEVAMAALASSSLPRTLRDSAFLRQAGLLRGSISVALSKQ